MTCLHQLIEFANMQLAYRHDERPGESYEALDGKKSTGASRGASMGLEGGLKGGLRRGLRGA